MAMHDAAVGCWETKFYYFNPRPSQMDAADQDRYWCSKLPAFTSGHSTFSSAAATVLGYLFPSGKEHFDAEASEGHRCRRLYGAIHYRSDIEAGMSHGKVIGAIHGSLCSIRWCRLRNVFSCAVVWRSHCRQQHRKAIQLKREILKEVEVRSERFSDLGSSF